jgi:hypothetical protein
MASTASCVADARPARRVLLSKSDWLLSNLDECFG